MPGLVGGAGVPPRRAVSCGWERCLVLAFCSMLRRGDRELTQSEWKEGGGWVAAASGGGASVV